MVTPKHPHQVRIAWGDSLPKDEMPVETYSFATEAELNAFMLGVSETEGWMGYTELELDEEWPPKEDDDGD